MEPENPPPSSFPVTTPVSRRTLLKSAAILAAARSIPIRASERDDRLPPAILAYVGTYTPNGQGIHLFSLDTSTGQLSPIKVAATVPSPSWLALHPNGTFLYAVNEISNFNGSTDGSVSAFSINRATGDLTLLNAVSSQGGGPAHVSVDPTGKFAFVANYGGGSIAVLPIQNDGSLANASDVKIDIGSVGPTKATNAPPGSFAISGHDATHAHMVMSDPLGGFVLHTDLGQDRIYSWTLDSSTGKLSPNSTAAFTALPPGDGPRHFAFHPNGQWLYSLQEEASTLVLFDYDSTTGVLSQQQMVSTLPASFAGTNFTSEVRASSDGRFVMVANRLHNSVAFFRVNSQTGELTLNHNLIWTQGDYPRSFTVDPTGNFLCVCNQRSDVVTTFRIEDNHERRESSAGLYTPVGNPACIQFLT